MFDGFDRLSDEEDEEEEEEEDDGPSDRPMKRKQGNLGKNRPMTMEKNRMKTADRDHLDLLSRCLSQ